MFHGRDNQSDMIQRLIRPQTFTKSQFSVQKQVIDVFNFKPQNTPFYQMETIAKGRALIPSF